MSRFTDARDRVGRLEHELLELEDQGRPRRQWNPTPHVIIGLVILGAGVALLATLGFPGIVSPAERCRRGDGGGCLVAGDFAAGCAAGNGASCAKLAEKGDHAAVRAACEHGRPEQCVAAADTNDDDAAVALYTRGCVGGDARACGALGDAWATGAGNSLGPDPIRAVAIWRSACYGKDAAACQALGDAYATGLGTPIDQNKAGKAYARACSLGRTAACEKN